MTRNQRRAVALAADLRRGRTDGVALSDDDWTLLLLAGGLNKCQSPPDVVAARVLDYANRHAGYFGPPEPVEPSHAPHSP